MLQDGRVILDPLLNVLTVGLIPFMEVIVGDAFQLWDPFLYVQAVLVKVFLLCPWVEYSEVWLGVGTVAYCPLPSSGVLHG